MADKIMTTPRQKTAYVDQQLSRFTDVVRTEILKIEASLKIINKARGILIRKLEDHEGNQS